MKKLLALFLCAVLLLSLVPAAAYAADAAPEAESGITLPDEVAEPVEYNEPEELDEPEAPTGLSPAGHEAPPDEPWDPAEEETIEDLPEEELLDPEEIRAQELAEQVELEHIRRSEDNLTYAGPSYADVDAADCAVTLNLKLPSGVTATSENKYNVRLQKAYEFDKDGKMIGSSRSWSASFTFDSTGAATVTINVEAGSYFVSVYTNNPVPGMMGGYTYLNADGTRAANAYVATTFQVSGKTTRNITLPKAERTISGTVTFTKAAAYDQELYIYRQTTSSLSTSGNSNYSVTVPAGARSVDFCVGVDMGSYSLEFSMFNWGYYSLEGKLTQEYDERFSFNVMDSSVSGVTLNGDELLGKAVTEHVQVEVTVKLPKATDTVKTYHVFVFSDYYGNYYSESDVEAAKGASTLTCNFWLPKDEEFYFGYEDSTNISFNYNEHTDTRYGAESGITTLPQNAKTYTFTKDAAVTIDDTVNYTVTGTLDRGDFALAQRVAGYAFAEFEDGERYAALVNFPQNSATSDFTIYVPQSKQGETFSLYAARTENLRSNRVKEDTRTEPVSLTLNGNTKGGVFSVPGTMVTASGKVVLAQAATEPIAMNISVGSDSGIYLVRTGQTEVNYSLEIEEIETVNANVNLQGRSFEFARNAYAQGTLKDGAITVKDITLPTLAKISGKVTLPEEATENAANIRVYASASGYSSCYINLGIWASAGSDNYTIYVPDGATLSYLRAEVAGDATGVLSTSIYNYANSDWTTGATSSKKLTVSGDRSGVDFTLTKAVIISGSFVAEDGSDIEFVDGFTGTRSTLYLNNNYYQMNIKPDATWSVAVPSSLAGTTVKYLEFYTSRDSFANVLDTWYYYKEGAVSTSQSDTTQFTLTEEDVTGIKVYVRTGWKLNGRLLPAAGGQVSGVNSNRYFSVSVNAKGGGKYYYGSAKVNTASGPWTYSIIIPKETAEYTMEYSRTNPPSEFATNIAFNADVESEAFQVSKDNSTAPDLTLPLAKATITGTVTRPSEISKDVYISFSVYVETENDSYQGYGSIDSGSSRGSYAVTIPESDNSATYKIYYYCYEDGLARYGYRTKDGVSTKESEMATFSFADDSTVWNFTFLVADPFVVGKIYLPEGITKGLYFWVNAGNESVSINVNPESIQTDSKGSYVPYKITTSRESYNNFRIYYEINEDPNEILSCGRDYYVAEDGSVTEEYSSAKVFSWTIGTTITQDITLARGLYVKGTLVTDDGSALKMKYEDNQTYSVGAYFGEWSCQATVKSDGSWAICLPLSAAGSTGKLRIYMYSDMVDGVVTDCYYYYSTGKAAVTNEADATELTVPATGLTGLKLVLQTGWTITGRILPEEGGYLRMDYTTTHYLSIRNTDGDSYEGEVEFSSGSGPWTYSVIVPKKVGTYTVEYGGYSMNDCDTNIIFSKYYKVSKEVNGDTEMPDLVLEISRAAITGTVSRPAGSTGYLEVYVYVTTYNGEEVVETYSQDIDIYNNSNSATYKINIPSSDKSTSYTVHYNAYYNDAAAPYGYLKQDGTLSYQEADAWKFSFTGSLTHDFTLLERIPFLTGKIRFPAGLTEQFSFYVETSGIYSYKSFTVDPADTSTYKTDANGPYVEYTLSTNSTSDSTFYVYYYVSSDPNGVLVANKTFYLQEDGTFKSDYDGRKMFDYTLGSTQTIDFALKEGIKLSGRFLDETGAPLTIAENYVGSSLYAYSSKINFNIKLTADGWYTILDENGLGDYTYLYVRVYNSYFTVDNIIEKSYYYADGKATTNSAEATAFTVTEEGLSGLDIRVNTGWVLLGKVVPASGGYIKLPENSTPSLTFNISNSGSDKGNPSYSASANVTIDSESGPWFYRFLVPKLEDNYTISFYGNSWFNSSYETNIMFSERLEQTVEVKNGTAGGPTLTLPKIKATISGTVSLPYAEDGYRYGTVYAVTDTKSYSATFSIDSGSTSTTYSLNIPSSDPCASYTIYYYTYGYGSGSGRFLTYGYLMANGVSDKEADKYPFKFGSDPDKHDFTLIEKNYVIQSEHGKKLTPGTHTYTYKHPVECSYMYLYFTYADLDVQAKCGENETVFTAKTYRDSLYVNGGTEVTLTITVPDDGNTYYGFAVDEIYASVKSQDAENAVATIYTENNDNSDEAGERGMIEDLQEGSDLNVVLLGDTSSNKSRQALAALYDADGRFLEIAIVNVQLSYNYTAVVRFSFEKAENVATVKIILIDSNENFQPIMEDIVIE